MTWTYAGDPSANTRDEVRWLAGLTDISDQLVSDEEIAYALATEPSTNLAAALVLESLATKFARTAADRSVGDVSISLSQRAAAYRELAEDLRSRSNVIALPLFGGISIAANDVLDADTNAVQPSFRIGLDDHPGIPSERADGDTSTDELVI